MFKILTVLRNLYDQHESLGWDRLGILFGQSAEEDAREKVERNTKASLAAVSLSSRCAGVLAIIISNDHRERDTNEKRPIASQHSRANISKESHQRNTVTEIKGNPSARADASTSVQFDMNEFSRPQCRTH